jgi:BirA family biotin operon repressor/biotin-[acetyl-CoA-carboxylase] ligase
MAKRIIAENPLAAQLPYSVIIGEEQLNGYGTNGRSWISPKGNIYLSFIVPKNIVEKAHIGRLSIATSVAVANVIKNLGIKDVSVKWPNDILIENKKITGILVEIEGEFAIIGVGINIQKAPSINNKTTCIKNHCTLPINIESIIDELIKYLLNEYDKLQANKFNEIKQSWSLMCPDLGKIVKRETEEGVFLRIGNYGEMIMDCNGVIKTIFSVNQINSVG